jgi:hypothetical protein
MKLRTLLSVGIAASLLSLGCGPEEKPYVAKEAYSGKKPTLPQVPTLPNKAKKEGDAYNIYGAMHDLHSVVHEKDFDGKQVSIVGYIVLTNLETECKDENVPEEDEHCVPKCANHKTGKADPPECKAKVPTFWIADSKDEKDIEANAIPVKGWASNFAQIFSLAEGIDKEEDAALQDEFFGMDLPNPLPNVGAKVKVTGSYGYTYTKSTGGAASNPRTGIMTAEKLDYVEPPAKRIGLPGQKLRNVDMKKGE